MKKLILIILALWSFTAYGQSYSSPGRPAGVDSKTPTFGIKTVSPDSLSQLWLSIGGNRWFRLMTGMDVIVFDAKVFQGLGTTSSKLTFRDTLLKSNWVINPADTLHPVLTLIQKKSQDNLWLKGTGITDGRATIRFTTEKDTGDYEYGFLAGGDNNLYGLRNVRAATPPNISWVWSVNAHNSDYTNFYRHVGMTGLTDTSTAAKILAIDANGKLFKVPYSGGGGSDSTLYKVDDSLRSDRTVTQNLHSLDFYSNDPVNNLSGDLSLTPNYQDLSVTDSLGNSGQVGATTRLSNNQSVAFIAVQNGPGLKLIQMNSKYNGHTLDYKGIYVTDKIDSVGLKYTDTASYKNGHLDSLWIPPLAYIQSHFAPIGGSTTVHTSNGLSGDGSVGTPVVLGGTLTTDADILTGAANEFLVNSTSSGDIATLRLLGGDLLLNFTKGVTGRSFVDVGINGSTPQLNIGYNNNAATANKQIIFGTNNIGIWTIDSYHSIGFNYAADYGTNQRLHPNSVPSVKTVIALADSVKGTISAGASPGNPSGLLTFTASNGSNATYLRNDGLHAIDSTVVRSVANSYSLSGMQTKLNNYALTSALPVGANPTATAGSSVVNGSATTFMRSDAAPKVDSAVFRTVANSYSLSGLQTKFNGYVPTSTTVAGFPLSSNVTLAALTATDATLTFSGSYTGATARTVGLNLGNANTWTVAQSVALTALGTTQTEAQRWQNTTAAAVGAVQISPFSVWYGNNWSTGSTASVLFGFRAYTLPIQNSSGYNGEWHLQGLTALNTWADALKVDNGGTLTAVNFVSNGGEVNSGTFRNASSNSAIFLQTARTFNASGNIITFNPGSITNSSGLVIGLNATQTINQTSTASYTYNQVNLTETAVGSGGAKFVDYQVGGTSKYSVKDDGTINSAVLTASTPLQTDASKNIISSPVGQTTLVAGTKAITITGLTTSSKAFVTLVSQGGTVTTTQVYAAVCTSNTLTITALTTAGATDTTDTSVLNYFVVVQ